MSFAFTCGSLGDIIAVTNIIKDLIELLDDSKGSVKDYHEVVARLRVQLVTVNRVGEIFGGQAQTPKEAEMQAEVWEILAQIRQCADNFLAKLAKFAPSLANSGSNNKFRDVLKKVSWRLEKKEIEAFEKNVATYTKHLDLYIGVVRWYAAESIRDQLSSQITRGENTARTARKAQSKSLRELQAFLVAIGRALLLKLNQVAQACQDTQKSVTQIFHLGFALLPLLQIILCRLEQLTPPPEDIYFVLIDHLGGRKKIFLDNILSWDMFYDLLAITYKSEKGARRLARRRFLLEQNLSNTEISRETPWKTSFRPSEVVHLRLDCRQVRSLDESSQCPGCGFVGREIAKQAALKCLNCNLRFLMCSELPGLDRIVHQDVQTHKSISQRYSEKEGMSNEENLDDSDEEDDNTETKITGLMEWIVVETTDSIACALEEKNTSINASDLKIQGYFLGGMEKSVKKNV